MPIIRLRIPRDRWFLSGTVLAACLSFSAVAAAQQMPAGSSVSSSSSTVANAPQQVKAPAIIDPAGPQIGLQTSEALFDVGVALNTCGYDEGLENSDPVRVLVRSEVGEAVQFSPAAQDAREKLCTFVQQHRLSDGSRDLAQYVSLALYLTPPPELTTNVSGSDLPPDSTQVIDILPLLRDFAGAIQLHQIWVRNRPAYEDEVSRLHDALSQMVVDTNAYLKTPASGGGGSRFLVVLEPLLAPGQVNARVYGSDYVLVASPSHGVIKMEDVRHTYLHYEIEPLLYARKGSMDRFLPVLKTIREAPLDYTYRADVVSLTIECMIKAIEARTMQTGVVVPRLPANVRKADMEEAEAGIREAKAKDAGMRRARVQHAMQEGFVLTQYFYGQLARFETEPQSFKESIGEMVYGMDVSQELGSIKGTQFLPAGSSDVVRRTPRQLRGLDLAEVKLMKGDSSGAAELAKQAIEQHTADPGRANFLLARVAALHGQMSEAQQEFAATIKLSKDPRMLAWSHIYLGRVLDIQEERPQAIAEYHAALAFHDGRADTRIAAEKGIRQAYVLPPGAKRATETDEDDADEPPATPGSAPAGPAAADTSPGTPDEAPRPNVPPLSSIPGAAQSTRPHHR